jgi:carbonic anhydrase
MMITRRRLLVAGAPALLAPGLLTGPAAAAARHQSPIALSSRTATRSPELPALIVDYPKDVDLRVHYVRRDPANDPSGCAQRGREETVEAEVPEGAAAVRIGDVRYRLVQFHFHAPSEHVLDGHRFPLEQHFVHKGPNGETLVIGLFHDGGGRGDTLADHVLGKLPVECGDELRVPHVDLAGGLPADLSTFRYDGSLTTDPYTEGVSWLVLRRHATVATATLARFCALFPAGDARAPQPLAGRTVRLREQP